ncbi:MAG: uracil/xanthine transporter [Acidibacillus sp.]|nr:uracil/xanthine transporter [Acidibacillus sp.]
MKSIVSPLLFVRPWLAGSQWLLFMFANTVVIPISVGAALHMGPLQIAAFTQRSFLYTGFACVVQLFFGHRLPILEGQSGVWWGVVLSVLIGAKAAGIPLLVAGGSLETGIILSGVLIMLLGALGLGRVLRTWFTPVATSVFLMLLATELISIFFRGMLGLESQSVINLKVAALSIVLIVVVVWISVKGSRLIRNFSILIGIAMGWIVFQVGIEPVHFAPAARFTQLFLPFAWGPMHFDTGIVITAICTGLINSTNTVATLESIEPLFGIRATDQMYRRSLLVTGFHTVISGVFGLVPYAPYTSSIGFLRSTQIYGRLPFALGAIMFMILGMVSPLSSFFSTLPVSVGDAVLLVAYLQLFGSALQKLDGIVFTSQSIYRIALPTLVGIALLSIPGTAFLSVPSEWRTFLGNGLLVGVAISIALENLVKWDLITSS